MLLQYRRMRRRLSQAKDRICRMPPWMPPPRFLIQMWLLHIPFRLPSRFLPWTICRGRTIRPCRPVRGYRGRRGEVVRPLSSSTAQQFSQENYHLPLITLRLLERPPMLPHPLKLQEGLPGYQDLRELLRLFESLCRPCPQPPLQLLLLEYSPEGSSRHPMPRERQGR